jgi:hypothetical protein
MSRFADQRMSFQIDHLAKSMPVMASATMSPMMLEILAGNNGLQI